MKSINKKNVYILGSDGWIGKALVKEFSSLNFNVIRINKNNISEWIKSKNRKWIVIYAIGLKSQFRFKLNETFVAHVSLLDKILELQKNRIDKFLYLSSTRVYMRSDCTFEESPTGLISSSLSDYYNITKLMGESLVLSNNNHNFKVVRISNVLGLNQPKDTFVGELIDDSIKKGKAIIKQSIKSSKDYISLDDVANYLKKIILNGNFRIYNVSSGYNISHKEIAYWLIKKGFKIEFNSQPSEIFNPKEIKNNRLIEEFGKPIKPISRYLEFIKF